MRVDSRTLPTIEAGIKVDEKRGNQRFVRYEPGNGTSYWLLFTELAAFGPDAADHLGASGPAVLVTLMNSTPRQSMVVALSGGFLAWTYVSEKLGKNLADSLTLAEIIGWVTGMDFETVEEFERKMAEAEQADAVH